MKRWVAAGLLLVLVIGLQFAMIHLTTLKVPDPPPAPLECPAWPFAESSVESYIDDHGGVVPALRTMTLMRLITRATLGQSPKQDRALEALECHASASPALRRSRGPR